MNGKKRQRHSLSEVWDKMAEIMQIWRPNPPMKYIEEHKNIKFSPICEISV